MKKIKIGSDIRDKYTRLCWRSSAKCDSFSEINYKIERAIKLGSVIRTYPKREIQYHNLRIKLDQDKVSDIEFNEEEYFHISENMKSYYDELNDKVVI